MMTSSRALFVAMGVLVLGGPTKVAFGEEGVSRAALLFRQAQEAFKLKHYAAAGTTFEEASRLSPHAVSWLNAGEAWELDGDLPRAARDYDQVLSMATVTPEHRMEAARRLTRLLPSIATLELSSMPPRLLLLDGSTSVAAPGVHRLRPGGHTLGLADGAMTTTTIPIQLGAGTTQRIDCSPRAFPPLSDSSSAKRRPFDDTLSRASSEGDSSVTANRGPPVASWVAFGIATGSALLATALGVETLVAQRDYGDSPSFENRDAFYRARTLTNGAWGLTGIAATTGVVLWLTSSRQPRAQTEARTTTPERHSTLGTEAN